MKLFWKHRDYIKYSRGYLETSGCIPNTQNSKYNNVTHFFRQKDIIMQYFIIWLEIQLGKGGYHRIK